MHSEMLSVIFFPQEIHFTSPLLPTLRSMVALKQLRPGKYEIQRDDQIEMKNLRDLNNDHVVSFEYVD